MANVNREHARIKLNNPSFLQNFYEIQVSNGCLLDFDAFKEEIRKDEESWVDTIFSTYTGVCCFCGGRETILLWSHYADNHRGIAIGFDSDHFEDVLHRVIYSTERGEYHPLFNADPDDPYRRVMKTKSPEWSYEDEYRIIIAWQVCTEREIKGRKMHFLEFPPEAVREVVIGCRAPEELRREIIEIAKDDYPHAKILQAERHPTDFRIITNEIEQDAAEQPATAGEST